MTSLPDIGMSAFVPFSVWPTGTNNPQWGYIHKNDKWNIQISIAVRSKQHLRPSLLGSSVSSGHSQSGRSLSTGSAPDSSTGSALSSLDSGSCSLLMTTNSSDTQQYKGHSNNLLHHALRAVAGTNSNNPTRPRHVKHKNQIQKHSSVGKYTTFYEIFICILLFSEFATASSWLSFMIWTLIRRKQCTHDCLFFSCPYSSSAISTSENTFPSVVICSELFPFNSGREWEHRNVSKGKLFSRLCLTCFM